MPMSESCATMMKSRMGIGATIRDFLSLSQVQRVNRAAQFEQRITVLMGEKVTSTPASTNHLSLCVFQHIGGYNYLIIFKYT